MAEPIACGWHAIKLALATVHNDPSELKVLVIGGGAIGLGAAKSAQALGVQNITMLEPNEIRQYLLKKCG